MKEEEIAKLKLGHGWLVEMSYDPEWTTEEFLSEVRGNELSEESLEALYFALHSQGSPQIAECNAQKAEIIANELRLEVGNNWLRSINYNSFWTSKELMAAADLANWSEEAVNSVIFTLNYRARSIATQLDELKQAFAARTALDDAKHHPKP